MTKLAGVLAVAGLLSSFDSSGAIFCGYPPGQCGLAVSGSDFGQIGGQIGLTFRF